MKSVKLGGLSGNSAALRETTLIGDDFQPSEHCQVSPLSALPSPPLQELGAGTVTYSSLHCGHNSSEEEGVFVLTNSVLPVTR